MYFMLLCSVFIRHIAFVSIYLSSGSHISFPGEWDWSPLTAMDDHLVMSSIHP